MRSDAGLYTKFVSKLIFPAHERLKGHDTVRIRKQLELSQWSSREQLVKAQAARLRKLIRHAYENVSYYRRMCDERQIRPEDLRTPAELACLPLLTKALIRDNCEALKSRSAGPLTQFNTGGSTGEPLVFYIGRERVSHDIAAKWRATRWWGVDIGDREVVMWGSPIELGAQDWARACRDRILRTRLLSAFEMSEDNLDHFVEVITRMRPRMLFGYPTALALVAGHAERRAQRMDDLGIEVAFVTAERLYDDQRDVIARVFGCRVANGYGGRDAGFVAHECGDGGMHVTAEDIIVEIVDQDGNSVATGEQGEIVVTHLATGDYPFIRYRTGDIGVLSDRVCRCGRQLPILEEIVGRTTDFIVSPSGTLMHGLALIYVVRDRPGIAAFQIIQESVSEIRILLVPARDYKEAEESAIRRGIKERLGEQVRVTIERVPHIPKGRSGKYRHVVSRVIVDPTSASEVKEN